MLIPGALSLGPVSLGRGGILGNLGSLGRELAEKLEDVLLAAAVLVGDEALEPLVLRLESLDASLELGDLLRHLLGRLLERLLALLLLDAEAGAGSGVALALVLLGGEARSLLEAHDAGAGSRGDGHGIASLALVAD